MSEVKKRTKTEDDVQEIQTASWDDMREITLPRARTGEAKEEFVAVNGRRFQIPKGEPVSVPYPIWERLQIKMQQEREEQDFRDSIPNSAAPSAS